MIRRTGRCGRTGILAAFGTLGSPRIARPLCVAAWAALAGCGPRVPAGWDAAAAHAFQAAHRDALAAPTSPLAAIHSDYLGPGQTRTLGRRDREVVAGAGEDPVVLRVDTAFRCASGCAGVSGVDPIEASVDLPWGPLGLVLSPQPSDTAPGGRVLVFDPAAGALEQARAVAFRPVDPAWILPARFEATEPPQAASLATTRGLQKPFEWVGTLTFDVEGGTAQLRGYRMAGQRTGPLLVPFTDSTNGGSTYPVGRYVDVEVHGSDAVIDFNRATNPWCAYSPHFNCPVPPKDNALNLAVPAGELTFDATHPGSVP